MVEEPFRRLRAGRGALMADPQGREHPEILMLQGCDNHDPEKSSLTSNVNCREFAGRGMLIVAASDPAIITHTPAGALCLVFPVTNKT